MVFFKFRIKVKTLLILPLELIEGRLEVIKNFCFFSSTSGRPIKLFFVDINAYYFWFYVPVREKLIAINLHSIYSSDYRDMTTASNVLR